MIEDQVIDGYFSTLFGNSEPGQAIHHLMLVGARATDVGALGLIPQDKLKVDLCAIAPVGDVVDQLIAGAVTSALARARQSGELLYFAAVAIEAYTVIADGNEGTKNLARRLQAEGKLGQHPAAVEVTRLYAACRDGRRWSGEYILTGPTAGTKSGPDLVVGPLGPIDGGPVNRLLRTVVGISTTVPPSQPPRRPSK